MIYVSSDLHGYPLDAFQALLDSAGFRPGDPAVDELYILGDVIDRNGDGGISLLLWMMSTPNIHLLMGNHEAMLLDCLFALSGPPDEIVLPLREELAACMSLWLVNGGVPTLRELRRMNQQNPDLLETLLRYLRRSPMFELVRIRNRTFLLTHAGLGNFQAQKPLPSYTPTELLWNRPGPEDMYFRDVFTVFGHTPTALYGPQYRGRMLLTETWADIDTGAAAGGHPMVLRLNDMQPFYAGPDPDSRM